MIFRSGKEVKEIYLGSVPVREVYIGGRLVWQSHTNFNTGAAAVIVLSYDAEILNTDGFTYSTEEAVLSPAAHAKPYMRHVAPMTESDVFSAIAEVMPIAAPSDGAGTAASALPEVSAKIFVGGAVFLKDTAAGGGAACSNAVPANGEVLRGAYAGAPLHESEAVPGEGEAAVSCGISSENVNARAVAGDGAVLCAADITDPVYMADAGKSSVLLSGEYSTAFGTVRVRRSFATVRKTETDSTAAIPMPYMTPSYSDTTVSGADGPVVLSASDAEPSLSALSTVKAAPIASGFCEASAAAEIYEEQTDFDSSAISVLDILAVTEIDTMSVGIQAQ